jgi:hypothetical protein
MSDDLVAFLTARLDGDEAAAKAALSDAPAPWRADGHWVLDSAECGFMVDEINPSGETPAHVARHDPARVLREVEAKRALMTGTASWLDAAEDDSWHERGVGDQPPYEGSVLLLKTLAAVWSDHPDYRQEWRPPSYSATLAASDGTPPYTHSVRKP